MPLYVADYIADTAHLSAAEHGAYLLLIMHYWRVGKLPTDERQLQRIARMSAREWANSRDTIAAFFDADWTHKRIESELAKSNSKSNARAEAGSRGGHAKALKNKDAGLANATILPEQKATVALASSSLSQSNTSSLRSDVERRARKFPLDCSESLIALGCPESLVSDWKAVRKAKNAGPISQPVVDRLKREAAKAGVSVVRAVTICVERGWQGFDADWIAKPGARAGPSHDTPRRGSAGMFDALQEIRREMEDGARPNDFGQFGSPVLRISSG
jgi:uncharacterized protein YdaU (DUF1376 family)